MSAVEDAVDDAVDDAVEDAVVDDALQSLRDRLEEARTDREKMRAWISEYGDVTGVLGGIPLPLPEYQLVMDARHPFSHLTTLHWKENKVWDERVDEDPEGAERKRDPYWDDHYVSHTTYSQRLRTLLYYVKENSTEKLDYIGHDRLRSEPGRRFDLFLKSFDVATAVGMREPEERAMELLKEHITPEQYTHYLLMGTFKETSARSGVTYYYRRYRPTLATREEHSTDAEGKNWMKTTFLAALCLHPVGYYYDSFVGALTPSDDVLAHLLLCRADEHHFWKKCVQHRVWEVEAGL